MNHGHVTELTPQAMHELRVVPKAKYDEARRMARAAIRVALRHGGAGAEREVMDEYDSITKAEHPDG